MASFQMALGFTPRRAPSPLLSSFPTFPFNPPGSCRPAIIARIMCTLLRLLCVPFTFIKCPLIVISSGLCVYVCVEICALNISEHSHSNVRFIRKPRRNKLPLLCFLSSRLNFTGCLCPWPTSGGSSETMHFQPNSAVSPHKSTAKTHRNLVSATNAQCHGSSSGRCVRHPLGPANEFVLHNYNYGWRNPSFDSLELFELSDVYHTIFVFAFHSFGLPVSHRKSCISFDCKDSNALSYLCDSPSSCVCVCVCISVALCVDKSGSKQLVARRFFLFIYIRNRVGKVCTRVAVDCTPNIEPEKCPQTLLAANGPRHSLGQQFLCSIQFQFHISMGRLTQFWRTMLKFGRKTAHKRVAISRSQQTFFVYCARVNGRRLGIFLPHRFNGQW